MDIFGVNQSTNWLFPFVFRYRKPLAQSLYSTCLCLSVFLYFTIFSPIHTVTDNPKSAPKFNQSKTIYECPQMSSVSSSSLSKL